MCVFFFFKQKTAYELRMCDWSSDVCSSDLLLLVGDDPASKSSTVPAVSERSLAALGVPVLFPRNAEEIITLGMQGIAMSRASGCVVALKQIGRESCRERVCQ